MVTPAARQKTAVLDNGALVVIAVLMMSIGILLVFWQINAKYSVDVHLILAWFQEIRMIQLVFLVATPAVHLREQASGKLSIYIPNWLSYTVLHYFLQE